MYIGQVSKRTGASPKAIRLYESIGLLTHIERRGKYRIYKESDVRLITLIREAQSLNISLANMQQLGIGQQQVRWASVIHLLQEKLSILDKEVATLRATKKRTETYIEEIRACLDMP